MVCYFRLHNINAIERPGNRFPITGDSPSNRRPFCQLSGPGEYRDCGNDSGTDCHIAGSNREWFATNTGGKCSHTDNVCTCA
jgi:hypothetical protein